jgi:hypothetical protein
VNSFVSRCCLARAAIIIGLLFVQATGASGQFRTTKRDDGYDIFLGEQQIAEYRFQDPNIPRPYFSNLHAADGTRLTRTHPPDPSKDATDHRDMHPGLWLAFGDLNGVDFWRNKGRIQHLQFLAEPAKEAKSLSFRVEESYQRSDGSEVCRGTNLFHFQSIEGRDSDAIWLRWTTKLTAKDEPLVFGGQHEMGLGFRMDSPLCVKNGSGRILGSHRGINERKNWGREAESWVYSGTVNNRRAGIRVVIPKRNERKFWAHARDYGFLAVNPTGKPESPDDDNLPSKPFTIPKNQSITFSFELWLYSNPLSKTTKDGDESRPLEPQAAPEANPDRNDPPYSPLTAIPTFECMSLVWPIKPNSVEQRCQVCYRAVGGDWKRAQDLWYDKKKGEFRGSVVHLSPGTDYEFLVRLDDNQKAMTQQRTWSNRFPFGQRTTLPSGIIRKTVEIVDDGTPDAWHIVEAHPDGTTIDVNDQSDVCIRIAANHVIVRGITCQGAREHGILIDDQSDVVIEGCDISGWRRRDPLAGKSGVIPNLGAHLDSGIASRGSNVERVVIQGNKIHHPRFRSNNWTEKAGSAFPGSTHPQGPKAITFFPPTRGNHVFRWNDSYSDIDHMFNDIFLESLGTSTDAGNGLTQDSDIYGNLLTDAWDDGIEVERGDRNVRIWGNYFGRMVKCISAGYIWQGPVYIWGNVADDFLHPHDMPGCNGGHHPFRQHPPCFLPPPQENHAEKRDGIVFVYHNSMLGTEGNAAGWAFNAFWKHTYTSPTPRVVSRNNLWITRPFEHYFQLTNPRGTNYLVRNFDRSYLDQDYDLHNGEIDSEKAAGQHTTQTMPRFRQGHGPGHFGSYQLEPGTSGYQDAIHLPNFNQPRSDRGAHQADSETLRFGTVLWSPTP